MPQHQTSVSARVAAGGALIGLLATFAVIAFALVQGQVWRIAAAALLLGATVIGSWYTLTRRGPARIFAALLAASGAGLLLAVVFTGPYKGLPLAMAFVLATGSSLAGGYALHTEERPDEGTIAESQDHKPHHAVLLMNPRSGGGKVGRYDLPERCRERGIEPVLLSAGDDLEKLAREAIERGADIIGMAGGDGSQALVASIASEYNIPFVCVPAGTRNHLAMDLGLDRDDLVAALDAFDSGLERRVDLATVNGRVFVNNASMGLYAKIVQSPDYRDAKLKTAADMLPDLLGPDAEPFDLRFQAPDGTEWPYAHVLLVSNNPYQLDQLLGSGMRPRLNSGQLGVIAARIDGPNAALAFISLEAAGRVRSFKGWSEWSSPNFSVLSDAPIEVGIDGEATLLEPPLVFESLPMALRVRLPGNRKQVHRAPRRMHLTPDAVASLLALATGRS